MRLICTVFLVAPLLLGAAEVHVDGKAGKDGASGKAGDAMRTIQAACDVAQPGDTVVIHPGIYHEHVQVKHGGTADKPLIIRADRVARDRVVITGADQALRAGGAWTLEDDKLGLYSAPLAVRPTRALYGRTELYPYNALERLKSFFSADKVPAPRHGYFYDAGAKKVYVRLHASGKYGVTDPAKHVMSFGPTGSTASWAGTKITTPSDSNVGIVTEGPAYVEIIGITCETPGIAGIYAGSDHVTVRDCWFFGCRTGVAGAEETFDRAISTDNVLIDHCEYTNFPAFADLRELINETSASVAAGGEAPNEYFFWSRKGSKNRNWGLISNDTYEVGIASYAGKDWEISNCHIHDVFEAMSYVTATCSEGLNIHHNLIDGAIDNAVEAENHAKDLHFHHNIVRNVFEPVSWQPLDGIPWPGPMFVHHNLFYEDADTTTLWLSVYKNRGWLKAGADPKNWEPRLKQMSAIPKDAPAEAPLPGFLVYNNTVYMPEAQMLTTLGQNRLYKNFFVFNNALVLRELNFKTPSYDAPGMQFDANLLMQPTGADPAQQAARISGTGGRVVPVADVGFADPGHGDFSTAYSLAGGMVRADAPECSATIGAGKLELAKPGPQVSSAP